MLQRKLTNDEKTWVFDRLPAFLSADQQALGLSITQWIKIQSLQWFLFLGLKAKLNQDRLWDCLIDLHFSIVLLSPLGSVGRRKKIIFTLGIYPLGSAGRRKKIDFTLQAEENWRRLCRRSQPLGVENIPRGRRRTKNVKYYLTAGLQKFVLPWRTVTMSDAIVLVANVVTNSKGGAITRLVGNKRA